MLLRAIIIDDEQKCIDAIKILISRYIEGLRIIAESTKASEAIELIENYSPDIIFLDINMPEMSGFELLEKLERRNFELIFTTAHEEYALQALKANAIDYLLKPIDHEELAITIEKIKKRRENPTHTTNVDNYKRLLEAMQPEIRHKILLYSRQGIETIDMHDIISLESKSNYTKIYFDNSKTLTITKTLKEFEAMLCSYDQNFMRVHHSFIINLQKVARFLKGPDHIIMSDDQMIPLSKRRKDDFFRWLNI